MSDLTLTCETFDMRDDRYPPQLIWLLRGPAGVVQFKAGRHRVVDGSCDSCSRFRDISHFDGLGNCWQAWDLGYHSPVPRYDGQEPYDLGEKVCDVLAMEADCYYDGTSLGAGELLDAWLISSCSRDFLLEQMTGWYQRWLVDDGEAFASPITALIRAMSGGSA